MDLVANKSRVPQILHFLFCLEVGFPIICGFKCELFSVSKPTLHWICTCSNQGSLSILNMRLLWQLKVGIYTNTNV